LVLRGKKEAVRQSEISEKIDSEVNHDEQVGRATNTYLPHSVEPIHEQYGGYRGGYRGRAMRQSISLSRSIQQTNHADNCRRRQEGTVNVAQTRRRLFSNVNI
jgi:hypothetical protein